MKTKHSVVPLHIICEHTHARANARTQDAQRDAYGDDTGDRGHTGDRGDTGDW